MVASGVPVPNGNIHAGEIANMAMCFLQNLQKVTIQALPGRVLNIRIGIHTGPVCAGA